MLYRVCPLSSPLLRFSFAVCVHVRVCILVRNRLYTFHYLVSFGYCAVRSFVCVFFVAEVLCSGEGSERAVCAPTVG